jgi:hypothetical protein
VYSSLKNKARKRAAALLGACAFVLIAAGCHNHNLNSGFGVAWVSLTANPGNFTTYLVRVDSVILVGKTVGSVAAVSVPETIDFTKLQNISELWATASLPVDTYTSAIIALDYTSAQISVMVNGVPTAVTVHDATGAALTTLNATVDLDPNNLLTLQPTFATSNALRLAFNFDLAASNSIDMTTSPPTVTVAPFFTIATSASDNKLIRVRGPLINSSVNIGTYTVVVRPFFDEVDSLGTLSIFNDASTVYTLGGVAYTGVSGLTQLSQSSAGSTVTAAFTTFEPTATTAAGITAGIFHSKYVVAGSTLEDFYTEGIEGDVIARSGNTLTLRGATVFANAAQAVQYENGDSQVLLGPATLVTADGVATLGTLDFNSVSVGQHITARGLATSSTAGTVTVDSTGSSATNTGSVRLQSTELSGSLVSATQGSAPTPGSVLLNVQTISNWPVSVFTFAGTGTGAALDATPANYLVNTGALPLPVAAVGDPLTIDGYVSPFGTAPPDFIAAAVNAEPTAPATLVVTWTGSGTAAPFAALTSSGLTIDLTNAAFGAGNIQIGAENVDITTLGATPMMIVPQAPPPPPAGLPPVFQPIFSVGPGATAAGTTAAILSFNGFGTFVTQLNTTFATPLSATKLVANGLFDRASNTFTASSINVVL